LDAIVAAVGAARGWIRLTLLSVAHFGSILTIGPIHPQSRGVTLRVERTTIPPMSRSIVFCLALSAVPLCLACGKEGADTHAGNADAGSSDLAKVREDYRHQKQTDLALLDKGIEELEAKEKAAAAKTRTDLHEVVTSLKAGREAFVGDLHAADSATSSTWDSTKARLDKEWADLKAMADKAASMAVSAASIHKPGEMTCDDFVALAEVEKPKIVYWTEGYSKNGRPVDSVVDVQETDKMIPVLVSECTKSPKESLSKVIQRHASTAPKAVAAAPAPAKMTCQEFVALEEVVKPKVVYWAEGFDKDGGVTDAVVDIDATDRLVPVLVKECTEAPKLTLWQKIKKYL
jgi:acid stress chaperone HdeA